MKISQETIDSIRRAEERQAEEARRERAARIAEKLRHEAYYARKARDDDDLSDLLEQAADMLEERR